MTKREPIGLGVIGVGNIGVACMRAASDRESGFALRAICGLEAEKLERTARELGVPFATREYGALLERSEVEAVAIYSPDHLHFPMIRDALLAGKHVLVTKPMVISSEESAEVLRLERETGRAVLVGETSRYDTRAVAAKRVVDDGDLGRLIFGS